MPVDVVMPQMGESLSEGTILKWLKKPGESVERDAPLFEITTDKVDTEVPAPASGRLERILVEEGQTVAVGAVVAVIGGGVEAPGPSEPPHSTGGGHFREAQEPTLFRRRTVPPSEVAPPARERRRSSPAVRALAAEHGLSNEELDAIPGSGRNGRLTRGDVERYLEGRAARPVERERSALAAPPERFLYRPEPEDKLVDMSPTRRQIAEHMIWSRQISAQVTSFTECDMHRIVRHRDEAGARFEEREGLPLTFLPFVAQAVVAALHEFPIFNASVIGDRIALRKHVHLGIAASLEEGLVAAVVQRADEMSFIGLARAIHALTEKARAGGLERGDVTGASFTLTSPGMFGGMMGTPLIPQPQVAILALGSVAKKPVVVDDAIAIRPIMALALSFDHRVIDGATAFQFLERIRALLESADLPELY